MFLRVDISNLVPAVFSDIVAILTAPAVDSFCKRAYGLGSQCRPNECLFWVWETPGGRDFG